jgi:thioredoxin-like negative regulator of GroEL
MRGRYDEGIASSHESLQHQPTNISARHNLALALGRLKRFDEALEHIGAGLSHAPKDLSLQRLEMRLHVLRLAEQCRTSLRRAWTRIQLLAQSIR